MSRYHRYESDYYRKRRPRARSKIMGVCAGLAEQFDWDVTLVRIVFLLSLFVFTVPTFLVYVIAGAVFY